MAWFLNWVQNILLSVKQCQEYTPIIHHVHQRHPHLSSSFPLPLYSKNNTRLVSGLFGDCAIKKKRARGENGPRRKCTPAIGSYSAVISFIDFTSRAPNKIFILLSAVPRLSGTVSVPHRPPSQSWTTSELFNSVYLPGQYLFTKLIGGQI